MSLETKINQDIKEAMKAKQKEKLESLRAVKSALLLEKTQKAGGEISENAEMKILQKLVKQRKDTAQLYAEQDRNDLAEKELFEASIIEKYLPEQMSDEQLTAKVKEIIQKLQASSMADMGKVMGVASKELAGKANGKEISDKVKKLLAS
ncbi:MAG: GatB/YqeY domain-containing protein [Bacteroidales bacterium]|nr:GatB/YqeY domain-containing protein [Bacteroidales bacterium]